MAPFPESVPNKYKNVYLNIIVINRVGTNKAYFYLGLKKSIKQNKVPTYLFIYYVPYP